MTELELDFLSPSSNHDAELIFVLPDNAVFRIRRLSTDLIRKTCPLLYLAFEDRLHCPRQACIQVSSVQVVTAFLRYLYTGDYLEEQGEMTHHYSLLLHAQVCKMAEDFAVPELQVSAYLNFVQATELSCSFPTPPLGLCDAVQFVYKHLADQPGRQQQSLVDALLNYCVFSFTYHGLGQNSQFLQVVFENPAFHKALCETSMSRGFEDEGAAEIICLPAAVCQPNPYPSHDPLNLDLADIHFDLFSDSDEPQSTMEEWHESTTSAAIAAPARSNHEGIRLAFRPKSTSTPAMSSDSESSGDNEDGFLLVHRPKNSINGHLALDNDWNNISPEMISRTATPSEDDWTFEAYNVNEHTPLITPLIQRNIMLVPQTIASAHTEITSDDEWSWV